MRGRLAMKQATQTASREKTQRAWVLMSKRETEGREGREAGTWLRGEGAS
jgi:hypothetical protein